VTDSAAGGQGIRRVRNKFYGPADGGEPWPQFRGWGARTPGLTPGGSPNC
jgi:hypothetical protein